MTGPGPQSQRPGPTGPGPGARWSLVLPVVLVLLLTLPKLGQGDFRSDTGWYAALSLQAWRTGQWWTLHGPPGEFYFNKPPLAFWIHGLALGAWGPELWAARLPSVLAAVLGVALSVFVGRRLGGPRAGLVGGVVLALTYEFARRSREISLDLWHVVFLLGAVAGAAGALSAGDDAWRRRGWWLAGGASLGLALMVKPLMALAAAPVLGLWVLWSDERAGRLARAAAGVGWMLAGAVVVALPWHASMVLTHGPRFTDRYFGAEVLDRAAGTLGNTNADAGTPVYYLSLLGATYWPWLLFVLLALVTLARGQRVGDRRLLRLALLWGGAWLVLLSVFPDRRPRYLLPVYPALAWLSASWIVDHTRGRAWGWLGRTADALAGPAGRWVAGGAAALLVLLWILPIRFQKGPDRQWAELFEFLRREGGAEVWQGGIESHRGARVYLELGFWPSPTRDGRGRIVTQPPVEGLLLYHARDGWTPGPNEAVVFASGDLTLTRMGYGGWKPGRAGGP